MANKTGPGTMIENSYLVEEYLIVTIDKIEYFDIIEDLDYFTRSKVSSNDRVLLSKLVSRWIQRRIDKGVARVSNY